MKFFANPVKYQIKKQVPKRILNCRYKNSIYTYEIPSDSPMTFKDFLDKFGSDYFSDGNDHCNFQISRNNEYIFLDEIIQDYNLKEPFHIFDFKLTPQGIKDKAKIVKFMNYGQLSKKEIEVLENEIAYDITPKQTLNFFNILEKNLTNYKNIDKALIENNLNIQFPLGSPSTEENTKTIISEIYKNIPDSIDSRSQFSEKAALKAFLLQIISPILEIKKEENLIIDFDSSFKGINTQEIDTDLIIKNNNETILVPIHVIPSIQNDESFLEHRKKYLTQAYKSYDPYKTLDFNNLTKEDQKILKKIILSDGKIRLYDFNYFRNK